VDSAAVANDDIDITERYGKQIFTIGITTQHKANLQDCEETLLKPLNKPINIIETKPTDKDLQDVRDLQLGIDTATQTQRLLNIPEIAAEWEKARKGDPYWSQASQGKVLGSIKAG
jgi:hypothetical protein